MNITQLFSLEGGIKRIVCSPKVRKTSNTWIGGDVTLYWSRGDCKKLPKEDGRLYLTQIFGNYFWLVATTCCSTNGDDLCWVDPKDIELRI